MVWAMWPMTLHTPSHAVNRSHCPCWAASGSETGGISAAVAPRCFRMCSADRVSSAGQVLLSQYLMGHGMGLCKCYTAVLSQVLNTMSRARHTNARRRHDLCMQVQHYQAA